MVRLACTKCERRGQYRNATLLDRYGADANMVALWLELAVGCPKIAAGKIWTCAVCTTRTAAPGDEVPAGALSPDP